MSKAPRISGRVVAAARVLAGISQSDFAVATGIPLQKLRRIEVSGSAWVRSSADAQAVRRGCEHFGVIVLDESNGQGAGVRLKFTRQDVGQVMRLENEGGTIGADDAP